MSVNDKTVVADILCEFLEIIVHNILYSRKLYPEVIFIPKKKYGVVVYQSVHPEVNEYIIECLKAVNFHAKKNQLKRIFLCIHTDEEIYEKYVFEVLSSRGIVDSDAFLVDLEQSLRSCILKLHTSHSYLDNLPGDASFSIRIETSAYSHLEFNQDPAQENFAWIELNNQESSIKSPDIVPLHTIDCEFLTVQTFIEKQCND